jgi:hypothetical protein
MKTATKAYERQTLLSQKVRHQQKDGPASNSEKISVEDNKISSIANWLIGCLF